jgi:hypothetical protein
VLDALIAKGALGQKTKAGFFQKVGKDIQVLDPAAAAYRVADGAVAPEVAELLKIRAPAERFAKLRASQHPQAQFLWAIFRDLFHYSAYQLAAIADNARDVDLAIRWGFGWQMGPFETWQAAGWKEVAAWIAEDIAAGKTLAACRSPHGSAATRSRGRVAFTRPRVPIRRRVIRSCSGVRCRCTRGSASRSGADRALSRRHDDLRDRRRADVASRR